MFYLTRHLLIEKLAFARCLSGSMHKCVNQFVIMLINLWDCQYKRRWICTPTVQIRFYNFYFLFLHFGDLRENNPFSPLNPDLFVQRCTLPNISIKHSAFLSAHITNWDINYRYAPLLLISAWRGGKDSGYRFSGQLRSAADTVVHAHSDANQISKYFFFVLSLSGCV